MCASGNSLQDVSIPWINCPSSPLPRFVQPCGYPVQHSQYFGVSGAAPTANWNDARGYWSNCPSASFSTRGVITHGDNTNIRDCTDGTSNTIIVGELSNYLIDSAGVTQESRPGADWGWAMGQPNSWLNTWAASTVTVMYPPNARVYGSCGASNGGLYYKRGNTPFTSAHTGGVQVLLTDGTVRFVSDNINMDTLTYLSVRDDARVVGEF